MDSLNKKAIAAALFIGAAALAFFLWEGAGARSKTASDARATAASEPTTGEEGTSTRAPKRARDSKTPTAPLPSEARPPSRAVDMAVLLDVSKGECLIGSIERCLDLQADFSACSGGDANACARAAEEVGSTPPRDYRIEMVLLDRSCRLGATEGCEEWGRRIEIAAALEDGPEAIAASVAACEKGDAAHCHALLERKGDEELEERVQVLHKTCELGFDRGGCISLAIEGSPEQSLWALRVACEHQSPDGCQLYARHLLGVGHNSEGHSDLDGANAAYATACELAPQHSACAEWAKVKEAGGWPDDLRP